MGRTYCAEGLQGERGEQMAPRQSARVRCNGDLPVGMDLHALEAASSSGATANLFGPGPLTVNRNCPRSRTVCRPRIAKFADHADCIQIEVDDDQLVTRRQSRTSDQEGEVGPL